MAIVRQDDYAGSFYRGIRLKSPGAVPPNVVAREGATAGAPAIARWITAWIQSVRGAAPALHDQRDVREFLRRLKIAQQERAASRRG